MKSIDRKTPPPLPGQKMLRERPSVEVPKKSTQREVSRDLMAEERGRLAQEIISQRKENKAKLAEVSLRLALLQENLISAKGNIESYAARIDELSQLRTEQANSLAGRIKNIISRLGVEFSADKKLADEIITTEEAINDAYQQALSMETEINNINSLIDSDETIVKLRSKLDEHYKSADGLAEENYERKQKTVEQTILRNKVFFVHTILEDEKLRHNENSNVSQSTNFKDDLDILLSLEPSISASSVNPGKDEDGKKSGLWSHSGGVILGGGRISGASFIDAGTVSEGIKKRKMHGIKKLQKTEEVDEIAKYRRGKGDGGYNEFVIDDPEVFGYFVMAHRNESGIFFISELAAGGKEYDVNGKVKNVKEKMAQTAAYGIPFYVMTQEREIYKCEGVNPNGTFWVDGIKGQLSPEAVAAGRAGLQADERKAIGADVVSRHLFPDASHHLEAKKIIAVLSGEEGVDQIKLSREECLEHLRGDKDKFLTRLTSLPKEFITDKAFLLEAIKINPLTTFKAISRYLSRELTINPEIIKAVYDNIPKGEQGRFVIADLPSEAVNKELALLAIDNHDIGIQECLSEELFNNSEIKSRLIKMLINNFYISSIDNYDGEYRQLPLVGYITADRKITEYPLAKDKEFMQGLKEKFQDKYIIESDERYANQLLVKKAQQAA